MMLLEKQTLTRFCLLAAFALPRCVGQSTCPNFPTGFVPFSSISYVTPADAAGDHLVVGVPAPGAVNTIAQEIRILSGRSWRTSDAMKGGPTGAGGIRPEDTLPKVIPNVKIHALKAFRLATAADFLAFKKLKNARLYGELGYSMPAFYVMADLTLISRILKGEMPEEIKHDLETLTERPLIVRTDGLGLPSDQREMLPRSDELRSPDEATSWLTGCFRNKIIAGGLQEAALALIAHHFIPSLASAWAQSEPGRTIVRVESLWEFLKACIGSRMTLSRLILRWRWSHRKVLTPV